ncbi:putative ABC transporter extracellular-binding protein YurO [Lentibacillus sp. JNUCC-1]|uniref:ABC transporter substrate-binding protein n=1 Tax=Lentibacillus sp. JNUCC-1 TaxID=2654513 RepID=UPI0012E96F6C|nr:ABC transporter substrate-binding protein [Lentibacillus sp. JNUCC-1]MUV37215.1 putative ABC transporter extracellular-binding protein YurO [Lentibacillus sp. JNUCC-1]
MKKGILSFIMLLLIIPMIAACSSDDEQANASGKDVVEIDFFHRWPNEPRKTFYNEKIEEYMDEHPNVKINVNSVLNDSYKEKIKVLVSSNELPDIFSSWSDSFASNLVSSGKIMPLDDVMSEDKEWSDQILESQLSGFTFDDTIYGAPFTVDGKAFFYNKKIFEENNLEPPETFNELISVLDKLQQNGYETPIVAGLSDKWVVSHFMGTIFQRILDPEVLEEDYNKETGEFTDPGYVEGLEAFQKLTSYMGDISTAINNEEARNMFSSGEVPISYSQFAEFRMVQEGGDVDFDFFDFPAFKDGKGDPKALTGAPEGWMLSENAPPEAVDFLKFLTSEETAFEFTKKDGQLNAIKGAVTEENTSDIGLRAYKLITDASKTAPWFDNAVDINVADVFMRGGQSLATNQKTPEEVMNEVQKTAQELK